MSQNQVLQNHGYLSFSSIDGQQMEQIGACQIIPDNIASHILVPWNIEKKRWWYNFAPNYPQYRLTSCLSNYPIQTGDACLNDQALATLLLVVAAPDLLGWGPGPTEVAQRRMAIERLKAFALLATAGSLVQKTGRWWHDHALPWIGGKNRQQWPTSRVLSCFSSFFGNFAA